MNRDTTDIANELLAENAALSADNRNYSELLQYHIDRQAKAEAQLAQRDAQIAAIDSGLSTLAGAMLNRTLDSGSKQAVAYAECADMVAKFAKQLREGK